MEAVNTSQATGAASRLADRHAARFESIKERKAMQSFKHLGLLVSMALFLSQGAFASNANSGSFDLGESAKVGSTVLPPGHYKAEWTGPEKAVKVSILRDGKTVATTEGSIKELPSKSENTSVTIKTLPDNSARVDEIDFNHRTEALLLSGL